MCGSCLYDNVHNRDYKLVHQTKMACIKVAVRIRPISDKQKHSAVVVHKAEQENVLVAGNRGFSFDHIYLPDTCQLALYDEFIKPVVEKFLTGINCTVLAYGQTGTGKTHTMIGINNIADENAGMIPRVVDDIFAKINTSGEMNFQVSFVEIYNEEVYDLLADQPVKLTVIGFQAQGLTRNVVKDSEDTFCQLEYGLTNRRTRATQVNTCSSRSHAIFTIYFEHTASGSVSSKLHLVDLAGSEGVRETGNMGQAMREGSSINKGLLTLGTVMSVLSLNNHDHIPYRSSTLTVMLQDCLQRNNAISLIACVSPVAQDLMQTVNTLRFAQKAKKVKSVAKINYITDQFIKQNPQLFSELHGLIPKIQPTPFKSQAGRWTRNTEALHQSGRTPLKTLYNFQIGDSQKKLPTLNDVNESVLNVSQQSSIHPFESSCLTASTNLEISSVLSPLIRKHNKPMEDEISEIRKLLDSHLKPVTKARRVSVNGGISTPYGHSSPHKGFEDDTNSVLQPGPFRSDDLMEAILNVQAELGQLRKKLEEKEALKKRKSNSDTEHDQNSARCKLLFSETSGPDPVTSDGVQHQKPTTDQTPSQSCSYQTRRRSQRAKESVTATTPRLSKSSELSVSVTPLETPTIMSNSRLFDDQGSITTATVQRKRKASKVQTITSTPPNVRRSARLSSRIASATMMTIKRAGIQAPSSRDPIITPSSSTSRHGRTVRGEKYSLQPAHVCPPSTVRRSARLSRRPPARYCRGDSKLCLSPPSMTSTTRKQLQLLRCSPGECTSSFTSDSPITLAQQEHNDEVLMLLAEGTLKDLQTLPMIGPKTAMIIYSYRSCSKRPIDSFKALQRIPGLQKFQYERFIKANHIKV